MKKMSDLWPRYLPRSSSKVTVIYSQEKMLLKWPLRPWVRAFKFIRWSILV